MAANPQTAVIPLSGPPRLAVAPFEDWKYDDASKAVKDRVPANYAERKVYGESEDHWNGGAGWIGPGAYVGQSNAIAVTEGVKAQFAPHDACGEVLAAIEDAFSTEAQIGAIHLEQPEDGPTDAQKKLTQEAIDLAYALWDRVRLHESVKPTIRRASYAERSALRWWIPPGRAIRAIRDDGSEGTPTLPNAPDFDTAAEWLALSAPMPDAAAIVVDEPTQERAAVYLDQVREGDRDIKRAQIAFVAGDILVIRIVYDAEVKPAERFEFNTPFLPMAEMTADNLLTPAVIRTQKQLDYFESVLTRSVETAGFPERYITNARPTGVWVILADGEVPLGPTEQFGGKTYQLRPERRSLGASITTEIIGIDVTDANGIKSPATPTVTRFEPVDPEFAIKAGRHARAKILQMCRQAHRAGDSTAESSGLAYQQARAAFEKDLLNRKGAAEGMLRDLLTGALGLIEHLTGQRGYFTDNIRLTVDMHVDAGPRSPEERQQDREDVKEGMLSKDTAMSRNSIEDVEGEKDRIMSQPGARLAHLKEVAEVFSAVSQASSAPAAVRALIAAGVDTEIANALLASDTDSVVAQ